MLLAACENLVVWCQDEAEGDFHAIIEVQAVRNNEDALYSRNGLIATQVRLLVKDNVFNPVKFNPEVFA